MKLTNGFKYSAIGIACLTALLLWRNSTMEERRIQRNLEYEETRKEREKEKEALLAEQRRITEEKAPLIQSVSNQIDQCLKKAPFQESIKLKKEDDMLMDYLRYLSAKSQDSIKRADKDPNYVLSKINLNNTLILRSMRKNNTPFNLAEYMKVSSSSSGYSRRKSSNYIVWDPAGSAVSKKRILDNISELKYLVVVQQTKQLDPKITGKEEFQSGYIVAKLIYFNLANGKKIEEKTLVSTNSSSITMMSGIGASLLRADLMKHFNKEVLEFILGKGYRKK